MVRLDGEELYGECYGEEFCHKLGAPTHVFNPFLLYSSFLLLHSISSTSTFITTATDHFPRTGNITQPQQRQPRIEQNLSYPPHSRATRLIEQTHSPSALTNLTPSYSYNAMGWFCCRCGHLNAGLGDPDQICGDPKCKHTACYQCGIAVENPPDMLAGVQRGMGNTGAKGAGCCVIL